MIAACGQMEAKTLEESAEVWPIVERLAAQASQAKADLLVLPETTYPAYWLQSVERYMQPDILRSAEVVKRFATIARQHRMYLVAGFVEERGGKLYNSAVTLDRKGDLVGIARKNFLWDCDNRWFAPGETIAAMDTEFGRVGVLICADCRAPEISATLVADGAKMLILPTAWVNASKVRGTFRNVHPEFLVRARSLEFGVPMICCSKAGREGDKLEYVGQSRIVAADGQLLTEAPLGGEHLIVAEVSFAEQSNVALTAARVADRRPAYRAASPGPKVSVNVKQDAECLTTTLKNAGARVAILSINDLRTFSAARLHALDGAQVLIFRGRISDDVFLRSRAAENRVFTVAADHDIQKIIQPDGSILYRNEDLTSTVELDLAQADLKQYTPETDLWAQRRVECYRLPTSAAPAETSTNTPRVACRS